MVQAQQQLAMGLFRRTCFDLDGGLLSGNFGVAGDEGNVRDVVSRHEDRHVEYIYSCMYLL